MRDRVIARVAHVQDRHCAKHAPWLEQLMNSRFLSADPALLPDLPRRHFIAGLAAGGVLTSGGFLLRDARAQAVAPRVPELRGTDFDLTIGEMPVNFTGRTRPAVTVNGSLPAPTLRWREGTTVELRVRNALAS